MTDPEEVRRKAKRFWLYVAHNSKEPDDKDLRQAATLMACDATELFDSLGVPRTQAAIDIALEMQARASLAGSEETTTDNE